jgi:hypothetical protein
MVQTAMQYTPAQVLQAARRAEAEGKMDYALQFYRHLVEQHGATPEAQEAREGLFRIAEWRWGEARIARRQDGSAGSQFVQGAPPSPPQPPRQEEPLAPPPYVAKAAQLPQAVSRAAAGDDLVPLFKPRYRAAKVIAYGISGLGLVSALVGIAIALAAAGAVEQFSGAGLFGLPLGVALGIPATVVGLLLLLAGQLAVAVFDSANANLEMLTIERGRASF